MPESTDYKINPEMAEIEVGVRYLRKVTFFPLSNAHEIKMTKVLKEIFAEMAKLGADNNEESLIVFVNRLLDIITDNIQMILGMISDEPPQSLLEDMTNSQLVKVVEYVYKTNFEEPAKNLQALFQGEEEQANWKELISGQLLQPSVKPTTTDLKTSSKKASKKVASQGAK